MATTTTTKTFDFKKINFKDFAATAIEKIGDSIGDMVITVLVLGMSIAYMTYTIDAYLLSHVIGYYIAGMIVQLLIRIVHRFDDSYTVQELADRVIEFEQSVNEKLDRIENNL